MELEEMLAYTDRLHNEKNIRELKRFLNELNPADIAQLLESIANEKKRMFLFRMLTKEMGELDFSRDAVTLERLIRGFNPWPSAYTRLGDKTLKIWAADVCEKQDPKKQPGTVTEVAKQDFTVACGEGALKITELQLQGKKRMDAAAFLRGYHLEAGMKLG